MKYQSLSKTFATVITFIVLNSSATLAKVDDRTIEKTRENVENASPDDWYTLAISAEKCFKKKVNLKQASEWLDQSIEIAETPFNLELKGDYYNDNRLPDKALEYYVRAMNTIKENDGDADVTHIQKKISKIINIGG
jgi:tetratricopeptide (TPR) repeat protein